MKRYNLIFLILFVFLSGCTTNTSQENTATKDSSATKREATSNETKHILIFGDSITAGYGLEDPTDAFPGVLQQKIDSAKLNYKVINAGLSGETSAGGKARIDWLLKKQPVDIFVLELGGNDGLRGLPVTQTQANLQEIISKVKAKYPAAKIIVAGMQIPPNMGIAYTANFAKIFTEIAVESNAELIPFILQGVGGERKLNQDDGIHPTEAGHKIVAENVWKVLKNNL